jgi:hypothetical protein
MACHKAFAEAMAQQQLRLIPGWVGGSVTAAAVLLQGIEVKACARVTTVASCDVIHICIKIQKGNRASLFLA